jgi:hypothetical protein
VICLTYQENVKRLAEDAAAVQLAEDARFGPIVSALRSFGLGPNRCVAYDASDLVSD